MCLHSKNLSLNPEACNLIGQVFSLFSRDYQFESDKSQSY